MDVRLLIPTQISDGAFLRADGVAVGLVVGGAPAWDLMAREDRAQTSGAYHQLLMARQAPLDIYLVDAIPDVERSIITLLNQQERAESDVLADILGEIADYLDTLARRSVVCAKQVIWAVTASEGDDAESTLNLGWLSPRRAQREHAAHRKGVGVLREAQSRARQLAASLSILGGFPPPRPMTAEEIARLVYQCADPIRAQRFPPIGPLLERLRSVITE